MPLNINFKEEELDLLKKQIDKSLEAKELIINYYLSNNRTPPYNIIIDYNMLENIQDKIIDRLKKEYTKERMGTPQ